MRVSPFTVFLSAVFVLEGANWTAGLLVKVKRHLDREGDT